MTNEKAVRPSTKVAPIGDGGHQEELVGQKERIEEQRHKLSERH